MGLAGAVGAIAGIGLLLGGALLGFQLEKSAAASRKRKAGARIVCVAFAIIVGSAVLLALDGSWWTAAAVAAPEIFALAYWGMWLALLHRPQPRDSASPLYLLGVLLGLAVFACVLRVALG